MSTWFERLKKRREELKLTQADVYRAIGVSNYSVSSWESGKHKPEGENLMALCRILKCDPEWLLTGQDARSSTGHDNHPTKPAAPGGSGHKTQSEDFFGYPSEYESSPQKYRNAVDELLALPPEAIDELIPIINRYATIYGKKN